MCGEAAGSLTLRNGCQPYRCRCSGVLELAFRSEADGCVWPHRLYAKAIDSERIEVRKANESEGGMLKGESLTAPYDDPLHYLAAVLNGGIGEGNSLSSLNNNMTVSEILDAARQSAQTGKSVSLPLTK
jgi:hypothetical protein